MKICGMIHIRKELIVNDIIDALHDHIQSMYDTSNDQAYWDALESSDIHGMLDCVSAFHDPASCDICNDLLFEYNDNLE